ncbi:MAG: DJ-1/PfpI family protein [Actinobacteria bacterium]|nr:DJ-1/PfpI family protein [Actinomycetota bacterium]
MQIDILVYDGNDELDVVGPFEVFRLAGELVKVRSRLVTLRPQNRVKGSHGLKFKPDAYLLDEGQGAKKLAKRKNWPDVIVVPGGGWNNPGANQGARLQVKLGDIPTFLTIARRSVDTLASVCTGAMLLAEAGVIGKRAATTHASAMADLAATGADVRRERVVDEGDLITSGGVTSGIDLALWLLEREFGRRIADDVAGVLEYQRWRPSGTQP